MPIARQSIVHPLPEEASQVEALLDELEAHFATFPGYRLGFRYRPVGNHGEIGRIGVWDSSEAANHASQDNHVVALRARLMGLLHGEHMERVLEIEGTPQNLPSG